MNAMPPIDVMERAYLTGDGRFDGLFVLGVRTTGIFCRPTCPARKPFPRNVEFFAGPAEATRAGYRPCKRCRPAAIDDRPAWAAALVEEIDREPTRRITDAELSARGIDPATVRRHFRRRYGMTFQAYSRAHRLSGVLGRVREEPTLDSAVFASGYESHSGFRDAFQRAFGAPPGACRTADCVLLTWLTSPLGPIVAGAVAEGVCLLEFVDRRAIEGQLLALRRHFPMPVVPGSHPHTDRLREELDEYFAGTLRSFTVPVVDPGTPFQRRVWDALRAIPYGETRSYEELAAVVGSPAAVRAVGRANGMNRVAILNPCHRVIRKGGQLGGYAGGLERKEFLLALERGERPSQR